MPTTCISQFSAGTHDRTRPLPEGGIAADSGCWISPVYDHSGPFDWAVASWNGQGARIEVEVRVATPAGWSPWFSFGPWSLAGERHSIDGQKVPGVGRLATDTLLLEQPVRAWQFRLSLENATVKRLWLETALSAHRAPDTAVPGARGADLPVPLRSQMIYPNGGNVWCSPTCLSMVMAFWGHDESIPDQVVPGVYDSIYDGHGNWPFNAAYAGARGFSARVARFAGFAELEQEIAAGRPVIASVAYNREWLPEAVYPKTNGHLLVVRGFTADGDVIVNDPAADRNEGVRAVYRRELFRRAWLDRGGVVYLIHPETQAN